MTGRGGIVALAAVAACCAVKALVLTGVLAAAGALTARPWLIGAAITVAVFAVWQTTAGLRRRGEGS